MSELPEILMVPVDSSRGSNAAAAYAGQLGERLDVPVRLLFVFPDSPFDIFGLPSRSSQPKELQFMSEEGFARLRNDAAAAAFTAAREAIGERRIDIQERVLAGDAAKAILSHAKGSDGCMIIIGRRGLSRFKEIIMGSVTQHVLHHAKCPVLVIR